MIGHARRVVDGPNDITLLYDLVTRLKGGNGGSVAQKQCAAFDAFGSVRGLLGLSTVPDLVSALRGGHTRGTGGCRFVIPLTSASRRREDA